jgi:hydrogenase nickel incorporation protein HypB
MAKIDVKKKVLSANDEIAAGIRTRLTERGILTLNLVSSPGAGKTTLLEKTVRALKDEIPMALVAGDVQTENDAERLSRAGAAMVRPIVTGGMCHLDASMVDRAISEVDLESVRLLLIENVGNLVCPSSYDLGEDMKVVLVSVTEGDDKPLKYPGMFRRSSLMVVNKTDLLPHCDFDMDKVRENALRINGSLEIIEISCRDNQGLDRWFGWLRDHVTQKKKR